MGKICYRPVFNRSNRLNAQGKALVQVEAYLERRKIYFSTHIYLTPQQWNKQKCRVVRHPEADALNYYLSEFIMKLEQKEMEIWRNGREVTLEALRQELKSESEHSFLSFVCGEIASSVVKESTRNNLKTTYKLLSHFKPNISFRELTTALVRDFEKFLYKKGLEINTVAKHLKHLRVWVNAAIGKGMMEASEYAFRSYKIRTAESKHTHLQPEELQKLETVSLPPDKEGRTHSLDAFLFCCYTGLRYSDFVNLKEKNVVKLEGCPWLLFHSVKTGVEVRLPLHLLFEGKPWELLCKYEGKWASFFNLKSNSSVNHDLGMIGKIAGIGKHFTFHTARHTNATLLLYQGAKITTVQKLLGHRNIGTTQIYSEVMDTTIVRDLEHNYR